MTKSLVISIIVSIGMYHINCFSQGDDQLKKYLFSEKASHSAQLFAPSVFNYQEGYHSSPVFNNDYTKVYFSKMSEMGDISTLKYASGTLVTQGISFSTLSDAGDPFLSPDNKRLYFLSFQPLKDDPVQRERIWFCDIINGELSEPQIASRSVSEHPTHWQFSVSNNYNLYFTSEIAGEENQDIYLSEFINGEYQTPVKLPGQINTEYKELCAYISPEEDYIIFSRSSVNTLKTDLFISYRKNNVWTEAKRLSDSINSEGHELCPIVSPDGKYLFFLSTRDRSSRIYWVSADVLK